MIKGELIGGEALELRARSFAPNILQRVTQLITRMTLTLLRNVKNDKLSGQVLNVRTGRLRRSINYRMEGENTTHVAGYVGTNVKYGRAQEYGFHGTVSVREHLRMQKKAFGKSIEPVEVTVRAHAMRLNLPERSFLRSALKDLEPELQAALGKDMKGL